jgi:hypothetical protein
MARINVANVWAAAVPGPVSTTAIVEEQGVVPVVTIRQIPVATKVIGVDSIVPLLGVNAVRYGAFTLV